jgi:hypothetical protein
VQRRAWSEVLKSEPVIDGATEPLFAAKILLCCLDRNMTEQKLDLFQLAACHVAELRARAPVMRCEPSGSPQTLFCPRHFPEHLAGRDLGRLAPIVYGSFNPGRNGTVRM